MPPVGGRISWVRSFQARIDAPMDILKEKRCVIEHRSAQLSVKFYNFLSELFLHTEMQLHKGWYDYTDEVRNRLNNRVLRKHIRTNWLEVNFHESIYQLIREGEIMLKLGLDVPYLAEVMVFCRDKVMDAKETLMHLIEENNRLRLSVDLVLFNLSRPLLRKLELAFKPGLSTVSWTSEHLDDYCEHVRAVLKEVGDFVMQTNDIKTEQIERVFESMLDMSLICLPDVPVTGEDFYERNVQHRRIVGELVACGSGLRPRVCTGHFPNPQKKLSK